MQIAVNMYINKVKNTTRRKYKHHRELFNIIIGNDLANYRSAPYLSPPSLSFSLSQPITRRYCSLFIFLEREFPPFPQPTNFGAIWLGDVRLDEKETALRFFAFLKNRVNFYGTQRANFCRRWCRRPFKGGCARKQFRLSQVLGVV